MSLLRGQTEQRNFFDRYLKTHRQPKQQKPSAVFHRVGARLRLRLVCAAKRCVARSCKRAMQQRSLPARRR